MELEPQLVQIVKGLFKALCMLWSIRDTPVLVRSRTPNHPVWLNPTFAVRVHVPGGENKANARA